MGNIMEGKTIGILVMVFIGIIVGLVFLGVTADSIKGSTTTVSSVNESASIATTRDAGHQSDVKSNISIAFGQSRVMSTTVGLYNVTDGTEITPGNYTVNYTETTSGYPQYVLYLINTSYWAGPGGNKNGNTTLLTYGYYPSGYVDGASGTIANLVILFGSIALLAGSAVVFFKIAQDSGIL